MDAATLYKSAVALIGLMSPVVLVFVATIYAGELFGLLKHAALIHKKRRFF